MYVDIKPWDPVPHYPGDAGDVGDLVQVFPHRPDQAWHVQQPACKTPVDD